jgi:stress response protein YsnF
VVTVSEERAVSRLVRVPVERVRVRTRVVTEVVRVDVEVRRQELVVERVPVDQVEASAAATTDLGEPGQVVVVLHEEVPVVTTEVRPVERVTVRARRVESTTPVTVDLSREVVEVEQDAGRG